jgi:hypothetical protein
MVVYDDLAGDKIAIYDKGIDRKAVLGQHMDFDHLNAELFNYRHGDILVPQVHFTEPLRSAAESFVQSMWNGKKSITGIPHARKVVAILEQAQRLQMSK